LKLLSSRSSSWNRPAVTNQNDVSGWCPSR
jgi:hypothetical protein